MDSKKSETVMVTDGAKTATKMQKIRNEFSDEFLHSITEPLVAGLGKGMEDRFRAEISNVRAKNHDPLLLEILLARKNLLLDDAINALQGMISVSEDDEAMIGLLNEENRLADLLLNYHEQRTSSVAKTGGDARAAKIKALEEETIRLYLTGPDGDPWPTGKRHAPTAALEITPKIVAFSKGRGDLFPTTTKPLEWIRAHLKTPGK